ncbi:MAG: hypothetical protein Q7R49_03455 [Candidatus Daviesbacteria bacterium]|nr:hypothetical protein [Candidatus Daviesbacteria bacterium]
MENVGNTIIGVVMGALVQIGNYLPQFLGGLVILIVGVVASSILRSVVRGIFNWLRIEENIEKMVDWFQNLRFDKGAGVKVWTNVLSELVRWTVLILFLIPAVEAMGLPKVTEVLNQFLLYIPNVFVAVVVGFVGLVIANLVHEVVTRISVDLGSDSASLLGTIARSSVVFFTVLIILNQLGVGSDLVRILFTGIVAMLALAGGIAFGLGGQDSAKKVLSDLEKKVSK